MLLVLDPCEHVIEVAAAIAEATLGASSATHLIATSREPLQAGGEWVYPVRPLTVPTTNAAADDDPLRHGAAGVAPMRGRAIVNGAIGNQAVMLAVARIPNAIPESKPRLLALTDSFDKLAGWVEARKTNPAPS